MEQASVSIAENSSDFTPSLRYMPHLIPDDPEGLIALAERHLEDSVYGDLDTVYFCLKKAASSGNAEAQFSLAGVYLYFSRAHENIELWRINTDSDDRCANFWLAQAAEQGHVEAQRLLARRYYWGAGSEKDMHKAKYWLARAAAMGSREARYNLQIVNGIISGIILQPSDSDLCLMKECGIKRVEDWYFELNSSYHPHAELRFRPNYPADDDEEE